MYVSPFDSLLGQTSAKCGMPVRLSFEGGREEGECRRLPLGAGLAPVESKWVPVWGTMGKG